MTIRFLAVVATMLTTNVMAQEGLYDAPLPQDAAFVRMIGGGQANYFGVSVPDTIGENYAVLHALQIDGLEPGQFVTLLSDGTILLEAERTNNSKVLLQFLNLGETIASLALADNSVAIVENVEPRMISSREVNPVTVPVGVFADGGLIGEAFELSLERGLHPTVINDGTTTRTLISEVIRTDLD